MSETSLRETAWSLVDEVSERAGEIERARTLPADLVRRFRAGGLFSMALPAALGGLECEPRTIIEVVERMAWADGSAGWTLLIGQGSGFFAWLDPGVAKELLSGEPAPVVAGSMAPIGRGVPAGNGDGGRYELTGRWPFASGCPHADWIVAAFTVPPRGEGTAPERRFAFLPPGDVRIIDTWNVAGLRGTGSHDIAVEAAFVPRERTIDPFTEPARHGGPLYSSLFGFLVTMMAGFPLGVARRALDELHSVAHHKKRQPGAPALAEEPETQDLVLSGETRVRAARALVLQASGDVTAAMRATGAAAPEIRARLMAAVHHAMLVAVDVVTAAFHAGGASALYDRHPLQRCFRDIRAARQHVLFGQETAKRLGRMELGLPVPPAFL
jgi:indole-3-acetate monooxygenase